MDRELLLVVRGRGQRHRSLAEEDGPRSAVECHPHDVLDLVDRAFETPVGRRSERAVVEAGSQRHVRFEEHECFGERARRRIGDHEAVHVVRDHGVDSRGLRRDDGEAGGEGLEDHVRQSFVGARHAERVGRCQVFQDDARAQACPRTRPGPRPLRLRAFHEGRFLGTAADDVEVNAARVGDGVHKELDSLHRHQPSDEDDPQGALVTRPHPRGCCRRSVRNDRDVVATAPALGRLTKVITWCDHLRGMARGPTSQPAHRATANGPDASRWNSSKSTVVSWRRVDRSQAGSLTTLTTTGMRRALAPATATGAKPVAYTMSKRPAFATIQRRAARLRRGQDQERGRRMTPRSALTPGTSPGARTEHAVPASHELTGELRRVRGGATDVGRVDATDEEHLHISTGFHQTRSPEGARLEPSRSSGAGASPAGPRLPSLRGRDRADRNAWERLTLRGRPKAQGYPAAVGTRLIFVTQLIDADDPNLGFVVSQVRALASRVDRVTVIANEVREIPPDLGAEVRSLGKERGRDRTARGAAYLRAIVEETYRLQADAVIAHMCPIYASIGAPVARLTRTPTLLWFTHPADSRLLRVAERLSTVVITAVPGSYPRSGTKVVPIGHAIDTDLFAWSPMQSLSRRPVRVVSVGRTSPAKGHDVAIRAVALAREAGVDARLKIVGPSMTDEEIEHRSELEAMINSRLSGDNARAADSRGLMPSLLRESDVLINANFSSADKVVLEAMASGRPALAGSPAFAPVISDSPVPLAFPPATRPFSPNVSSCWLGYRTMSSSRSAAGCGRGSRPNTRTATGSTPCWNSFRTCGVRPADQKIPDEQACRAPTALRSTQSAR